MLQTIRQFYNTAARFFDRNAIHKNISSARAIGGDNQAKTARQALHTVLPIAHGYDRRLFLKRIVSHNGIDREGKSAQWEFFFDLENCRAQLAAEWVLNQDPGSADGGSENVKISIRPFPPVDNPYRLLVEEDELFYSELGAMWKEERKRLPDLPLDFLDTNQLVPEMAKKGIDFALTEFSLTTGKSPDGKLCWVVQVRDKNIYLPLK